MCTRLCGRDGRHRHAQTAPCAERQKEHTLAEVRALPGRPGSCRAGAAAPSHPERATALGKEVKRGFWVRFARGLATGGGPWRAQVDDLVVAMDEALRPAAVAAAVRLRGAGRSVDLLLEPRKMRAVFKARACGRPAAGAAAAVPAPSAWPASAACPRLTRGACLLCSLRGWRSRAGAAQGLHEPQMLRPSCVGPTVLRSGSLTSRALTRGARRRAACGALRRGAPGAARAGRVGGGRGARQGPGHACGDGRAHRRPGLRRRRRL